ncbi:MAG: nucleoside kinase [Spirochaetales bacterium]|nr:nucleoside kinase [Spirochaetales bacterium]
MSNFFIELGDSVLSVAPGTPVGQLFSTNPEGPFALGALVNRRLKSLRYPLSMSARIEPVWADSSLGHRIYRKTLCFLLELARKSTFPDVKLRIGPSLGNAYLFFSESGPLEKEQVHLLSQSLRRLVDADLPIIPHRLPYSEALKRFASDAEASLLIVQKNEAEVRCLECAGAWALEHFPLAPSAGLLPIFDLEWTNDGLLLKFPEKKWPLVLAPTLPNPLLVETAKEYKNLIEILGIPTVPRLNEVAAKPKDVAHFVQVAETLQEKKLGKLADRIADRAGELKLILVAGPSSSGKTTFTKKLAVHLQAVGFKPRLLGLDDYFLDRDKTPKDADGNFDFETLNALDVPLLNQHLFDLLEGRTVETPSYDFKTGTRKPKGTPLTLGSHDILLIEGIHGLNDQLTPRVPRHKKFKIYVSPLTALVIDQNTRISTTDNRLIRRMVRDFQFRGYSAVHTLHQWPSVRRGEDKNIFPFQGTADASFNSSLDYELAVLTEIAVPLLRTVPPSVPEYTEASLLLSFLDNFIPMQDLAVPSFSILREFVGRSGFKY